MDAPVAARDDRSVESITLFGTMDEREATLGFRPQKEIPYNALLPYADQLDAESVYQLADIKAHLARVIQLRDIKVGGVHWCGQLAKYIRMFGLKFSKADHLTFICLVYELVTIPELDFSLVHKFSQLLITLLKKRELIPREELVIQWRPLYKLLEAVVYSPYEHLGLVLFPSGNSRRQNLSMLKKKSVNRQALSVMHIGDIDSGNIEQVLKNLIRACRIYFPVEATQEMLDEWRPLLCPFDVKMMQGIFFMEHFLPTVLYPKEHDQSFLLWFEELIGLWQSCSNNPSWESHLINLCSRVANDRIGYINWEPYLDRIFANILRSFHIPVGSKHVVLATSAHNTVDGMPPLCRWIAAMFGNGSHVQNYLDKLFKALESFYHPSNNGRWSVKLLKFLSGLPLAFVKRVQRERFGKKSWESEIPVAARLTDDDITRFVESISPVVSTAMFSKIGSADSAAALHNLASLRPDLVIPPLLEKTYPSLETLTEPHRLIACLQCCVSIARPMLSNPKHYPEGRLHIIPLLSLSLPGIDPNDIKKSLITFQLLSALASLVPIVDCSEAPQNRNDLSEVEIELCSATAQFEDFVLQFFDRAFMLVENSIHQHTRSDSAASDKMSQEEMMLEVCLLSSSISILQQCSTPIYSEALSRLYRFACDSIFEIKVAGKFTADLVRAAIKVRPEIAVKKFVPGLCEKIIQRTTSEDLSQEEHLDNEFLWNLLLLSQAVRCDGSCLMSFKDDLTKVLQMTLHLKCKDAQEWSGTLLRYLLKSLSSIYALDFRCTVTDWDLPLTEYLPIREWGKSGDLFNLGMKWHIPDKEEKAFIEHLLNTFLLAELKRTRSHCDGSSVMTREELLQSTRIISHCLVGTGACLPHWTKFQSVSLIESLVELRRYGNTASCDNDDEITLEGENVRVLVSKFMRPLLAHMLLSSEDDTKTLVEIIKVYKLLMYYHGSLKDEFEGRWKNRHSIKHFMENKLQKKKTHIRALLVDRTQLQHELRTVNQAPKVFTVLHRDLFLDLHRLAVSRYMEVRKVAQGALSTGFQMFAYSYRMILDDTIKYLKDDPTVEPHQFKGALYVILGENKRSLVSKRSWEVMNKLWPALVETKHCEKPSVLKVYDEIIDRVDRTIETTELSLTVSDSAVNAAKEMWTNGSLPKPSLPSTTNGELETGRDVERERNADNISAYLELVNKLVGLAESGSLGWRFHQVSLEMLTLLIRYDIRFPSSAVRLFVNNMVNSSINVRKICTAGLSAILKLQKRKHKLVEIDPYAVSGAPRPLHSNNIHPGDDRPDNRWLLYKQDGFPKDEEQWNKTVFVEKTHWGYYCWPTKMMVYAPSSEQPPLGRSFEELLDDEKPIYEAFTSKEFVDQLIKFLSLEENKGKDHFHEKNFVLFKGLFRNFDDTVLPCLAPHIERLVADTSHETHETSQRCAAEIISGLIRGSKHWSYAKVVSLWKWLMPLMKIVITNFTVESIADWGTCLATASENRDPLKISPLLELLMDNPLNGDGGSFGDSSRMYLLQGLISQQEWRLPDVLHRLYNYILIHLRHPYKAVRDRLGSTIVSLFLYDINLPNGSPTLSPRRAMFIEHILPLLEPLKDSLVAEAGRNNETGAVAPDQQGAKESAEEVPMEHYASSVNSSENTTMRNGENGNNSNDNDSSENSEWKSNINLCKTVLKTLQGIYTRMFQAGMPEMLKLLPVICLLESETKDPELTRECLVTLGCMSQSQLTPELILPTLETIEEVSRLNSWHARVAVLGYLQVMVFNNLFLLQGEAVVSRIRGTVVNLMCDEQLEVRELAGVTLGGLLHCGYLKFDDQLMNQFKQLSSTRIKKRSRDEMVPVELMIKRHAGVIGLSACILAFPYQVPDFMPQLLMHLSSHLNDPPPIQATVKKTLTSFKRTHLDSWHDHKQKFTDDQLVVLTELLVSPNYYA